VLRTRDGNVPVNLFDSNRVDADTMSKIERGTPTGFVGVPDLTRDMFIPLEHTHIAPENPAFNALVERDIEKTWHLGSNQLGVQAETGQTATESNNQQANTQASLGEERDAVAAWFCTVARDLLCLLQMFATADDFVHVVGPEGAQLKEWNAGLIQGKFNFAIKPNSQMRPDAASDQKRATDVINFAAKSPHINQEQLWRWWAIEMGMDPSKVVVTPPPTPPAMPEGFDWKSLDEALPTYANVYAVLAGMHGFKGLTPPAMVLGMGHGAPQQALTEGTAPEADRLDQHKADETGELPGGGSMVAAKTAQMVN
jgi:hypothetical protein